MGRGTGVGHLVGYASAQPFHPPGVDHVAQRYHAVSAEPLDRVVVDKVGCWSIQNRVAHRRPLSQTSSQQGQVNTMEAVHCQTQDWHTLHRQTQHCQTHGREAT